MSNSPSCNFYHEHAIIEGLQYFEESTHQTFQAANFTQKNARINVFCASKRQTVQAANSTSNSRELWVYSVVQEMNRNTLHAANFYLKHLKL